MDYKKEIYTKQKIYFISFVIIFILFGINPYDRFDWILENILTLAFILILFSTRKIFMLSGLSYGLIFVFLFLHSIGSHYTYSLVPMEWFSSIFEVDRNHFDRIVHLCFGLLLVYPIRELYMRIIGVKGLWSFLLPINIVMSFSGFYELFEWAVAEVVAPGAGAAFLGSQGDIWDAQKDMAIATLGAFITMLIVFVVNLKYNRFFKKELKESLTVKSFKPLGELKLRNYLNGK